METTEKINLPHGETQGSVKSDVHTTPERKVMNHLNGEKLKKNSNNADVSDQTKPARMSRSARKKAREQQALNDKGKEPESPVLSPSQGKENKTPPPLEASAAAIAPPITQTPLMEPSPVRTQNKQKEKKTRVRQPRVKSARSSPSASVNTQMLADLQKLQGDKDALLEKRRVEKKQEIEEKEQKEEMKKFFRWLSCRARYERELLLHLYNSDITEVFTESPAINSLLVNAALEGMDICCSYRADFLIGFTNRPLRQFKKWLGPGAATSCDVSYFFDQTFTVEQHHKLWSRFSSPSFLYSESVEYTVPSEPLPTISSSMNIDEQKEIKDHLFLLEYPLQLRYVNVTLHPQLNLNTGVINTPATFTVDLGLNQFILASKIYTEANYSSLLSQIRSDSNRPSWYDHFPALAHSSVLVRLVLNGGFGQERITYGDRQCYVDLQTAHKAASFSVFGVPVAANRVFQTGKQNVHLLEKAKDKTKRVFRRRSRKDLPPSSDPSDSSEPEDKNAPSIPPVHAPSSERENAPEEKEEDDANKPLTLDEEFGIRAKTVALLHKETLTEDEFIAHEIKKLDEKEALERQQASVQFESLTIVNDSESSSSHSCDVELEPIPSDDELHLPEPALKKEESDPVIIVEPPVSHTKTAFKYLDSFFKPVASKIHAPPGAIVLGRALQSFDVMAKLIKPQYEAKDLGYVYYDDAQVETFYALMMRRELYFPLKLESRLLQTAHVKHAINHLIFVQRLGMAHLPTFEDNLFPIHDGCVSLQECAFVGEQNEFKGSFSECLTTIPYDKDRIKITHQGLSQKTSISEIYYSMFFLRTRCFGQDYLIPAVLTRMGKIGIPHPEPQVVGEYRCVCLALQYPIIDGIPELNHEEFEKYIENMPVASARKHMEFFQNALRGTEHKMDAEDDSFFTKADEVLYSVKGRMIVNPPPSLFYKLVAMLHAVKKTWKSQMFHKVWSSNSLFSMDVYFTYGADLTPHSKGIWKTKVMDRLECNDSDTAYIMVGGDDNIILMKIDGSISAIESDVTACDQSHNSNLVNVLLRTLELMGVGPSFVEVMRQSYLRSLKKTWPQDDLSRKTSVACEANFFMVQFLDMQLHTGHPQTSLANTLVVFQVGFFCLRQAFLAHLNTSTSFDYAAHFTATARSCGMLWKVQHLDHNDATFHKGYWVPLSNGYEWRPLPSCVVKMAKSRSETGTVLSDHQLRVAFNCYQRMITPQAHIVRLIAEKHFVHMMKVIHRDPRPYLSGKHDFIVDLMSAQRHRGWVDKELKRKQEDKELGPSSVVPANGPCDFENDFFMRRYQCVPDVNKWTTWNGGPVVCPDQFFITAFVRDYGCDNNADLIPALQQE